MSIPRILAVLAVACVIPALGASSAVGATPTTPYDLVSDIGPSMQPTGRYGERHATAGDLNGDGVNDYWIGVPSQDVLTATNAPSAVSNAGRVYAINGRTRAVLYKLASPEIQESAAFGFFITNLGDVDGDGRADLLVGTDAQDTTAAGAPCTPPAAGCNNGQGKAWVFSGRTATLLYALNNPNPQPDARFGSRTGRAGDLNGDGVAESIVGASNNDVAPGCGQTTPVPSGCRKNQGQAFIFDGKTGGLFRTLNLPASDQSSATCSTACGGFGLSVQGPGDVNGDGVTDQLVNASSLSYRADGTVCTPPDANCLGGVGAMYLFSGANGALLARIDDPAPEAGATFGFQDAAPLSPGDVNGDGRADLFGNGFQQDGPAGDAQGRIWVFDGKRTVENPGEHGVVLYEPKDPTPTFGGQCCFSLDKTDYNKDGRPDLYVGASPHHAGGIQTGGTYVFDGRNGALLRAFELPPSIGQAGAGSFANLGSNLGWSVAAPGDLNGDGEPDYVAGAPFHDVRDDKDAGVSFVFLSKVPSAPGPPPRPDTGIAPFGGCPSLTANVIRGSAAGGRITGTPRGDRIFGGTGNDIVDALAGDDCVDLGTGADRGQGGLGADLMLGGLGDDRMAGSSGNDRLRGGGGSDRINGGFGNDRLHGQAGRDHISGSRGRDAINGGSSNDVISAGSSNDRVHGDQGSDRINGNSGNDRIRGNSGNDRITGSTGGDSLLGDGGNDRIHSRDGRRDRVSCGRGRDRVIADRLDRISRSCERVSRRR